MSATSVAGDAAANPIMCEVDWYAVSSILDVLIWPVTAIAILLLVARNTNLNRLFALPAQMLRKINVAGIELEIDAQYTDGIRRVLNESISELIDKSAVEYTRYSDTFQIHKLVENVIKSSRSLAEFRSKGIRATVHVCDIVFPEYLCQLVDYYPKAPGKLRRFSTRYGIIGISWRLEESIGEENAFKRLKGAEISPKRNMIVEWGMTDDEADRVIQHEKQSILCVLLRDKSANLPVGILYIDAKDPSVFGTDEEATKLANALESDAEVKKLAVALEKVMEPLRLAAPGIRLNH